MKTIFSIVLFVIFLLGVYFNEYLIWIDDFSYSIVSLFISDTMTTIMKFITFFADPIWCILFSVLVIIFWKKIRKAFLINLILVFMLNYILKLIFSRTRPIDINIITETGYSFPSGHAMISLAIYGFLAYLLWESDYKYKKIGVSLLVLLIVLIGISRIYLGVHYTSDVIAGFIVSLGYLLLFIDFIYPKIKDK
ncbi:MAG TPA: phosphatase PAP2 family protein [Candidatus Faecisoma merdavium]|nr:phosphatase PAP2 family protein [Candidatus Faecisoma merdavium]